MGARVREIVLPGDIVGRPPLKPGDNVYVDPRGNIRAAKLGLLDVRENTVRVIPLFGRYIPKPGDLVIGEVVKISGNIVILDINSAYQGVIIVPRPGREGRVSRKYDLKVGDVILAKVKAFDGVSSPILSIEGEGLGRLEGGRLFQVNPAKIPRVIGRRRSMITLLKEKLGCDIVVANNGFVWINSDSLKLALALEKALRKIEAESHVPGLSDRVARLLERELSG